MPLCPEYPVLVSGPLCYAGKVWCPSYTAVVMVERPDVLLLC